MSQHSNDDGGENDAHHLLLIKEVPTSLVALRQELVFHKEITDFAQKGDTFEECLGLIAVKLDIALDGDYDVGPLCEVLVKALRRKRFFPDEPIHSIKGLVRAEMVETEGEITLQTEEEKHTALPEGAVVTTDEPVKTPKIILDS